MGLYDIDSTIYEAWLKDKITLIEAMTKEEIEARVIEISKTEFLCKREWALLHQRHDKITDRKGIPSWLKQERDNLITDPKIKVDWDGDPRRIPKEKKPKENNLQNLLGIDLGDLNQQVKSKEREKRGISTPTPKEKPMSMKDTISSLISVEVKKPIEKQSPEELKAKADAMKERMRLAKEAIEKKKAGG